ncbi:MAG: RHS domain-containing protein, partial [Firmicutes bacterium]|nr:RHS domain-containing protein [Bacillota bacterium]
ADCQRRKCKSSRCRSDPWHTPNLGNIATMLYPNAVAPLEYHYNNLGQLSRIPGFIEGLSGNPGITYNQGLPQTVRYANGIFLAYTYDRNGRLDTRTDTLGGTQLFSLNLDYDSNSNIIARTVNGKTNTYAYDNLNQLLTASIYANQAEQVRAYDYGLGQVHEDYRGDKVVEVQPEDFEVNLDYAATSLSVIFNQVAQNIQRLELTPAEANHRLTNRRYLAIYYKTSGDYQKLDPADWEFARDVATGRITITFPDLLTAYELKIHCLFDDRDKDYLPVKKRGATSEFANLARSMVRVYRVYERRYEDYVYDRNGNRISETITTLYPRTYGYTYYPNSDRLKTRESSDGTTKWAFVYDNNGNLIEKGNTYTIAGDAVTFTTSGEGVVYWQYEYDVFNRLVSVKKNGVIVSSYVYDPTGLRIVKQAAETRIYDYDLAGNVIGEKNVSNGKVYSYVWVTGRHLARVDGKIGESGAAKYFYETDHLGSPMVVTDDAGNVVWRGDFAPFGEKVSGADAWVFIDTHGFTGKDWDEDVGLYYFNARWYDSELGRFVSEDLAEDPNNPNLYVYCINNPLRYMDPTGLLTLKGTVSTENEATLIPGDTTVIGSWGIVEQRDSYWKIAEQIYGKGKGYLGIQIARANGKDPRDPIYPGDVLYIPFMTEFETDSGTVYGYTRIDLRSFQETIKNRSIAQTEIIVDKPATYNVVKRTKDGIWNQEVDLGPFFGVRLKSTGKSSWLEGIHYNFALTEMGIDEIQAFKARTFGLWAGLQWSLGGLRYREHGWSIPSGKWGIDNPGIGKYAIGIRGGIRIHLAEASLKIPIGPIDISLSGFLGAGITGQLGYTPGSKDFYSFSIGWGFGGGISIGPSDRGFNIADLLFIIAPPELLNVKVK